MPGFVRSPEDPGIGEAVGDVGNEMVGPAA
jgi:hypothetical protein